MSCQYSYKEGNVKQEYKQNIFDLSNSPNDNFIFTINDKLCIKDTPINVHNLTLMDGKCCPFNHTVNANIIELRRTNLSFHDIECTDFNIYGPNTVSIIGTLKCNSFLSVGSTYSIRIKKLITKTLRLFEDSILCNDISTNTLIFPLEYSQSDDRATLQEIMSNRLSEHKIKTNNITIISPLGFGRTSGNHINIPIDINTIYIHNDKKYYESVTIDTLTTQVCDTFKSFNNDYDILTIEKCNKLNIKNSTIQTLRLNHPCTDVKLNEVSIKLNNPLHITGDVELTNMTISGGENYAILNNSIKNLTLRNCNITNIGNLSVSDKVTIINSTLNDSAIESIKNCGAKQVYMNVQ